MVQKAPKTQKSVAYQSRGAFRAFETLMQRAVRDQGLQIAHFDVLRILWEGDGVAQQYISDKAFITESSTAQVINQMEALGLIERRIDSSDRRKRMIYLLPKGEGLKVPLLTMTSRFYEKAVLGISETDLEVYRSVSRKLRQNVMAEYDRKYNSKGN